MSAGTALSHPIAAPVVLTGKPWYTTAALVLTDAFALLLSVAVSVVTKAVLQGGLDFSPYLQLWPFLFVFLIVYASIGLYNGVGVGAPEELRRATIASTVLFVCLAAFTFTMRGAHKHFTWTLILAIFLSVAMVPLARECVRQLFAGAPWWGYPAVIFGAGRTGQSIVKALLNEPGLGLKPIAMIDQNDSRREINGVPVLSDPRLAPFLFHRETAAYAVFAMPDIPQSELLQTIERYGTTFSHVLVVPELTDLASLWVSPKSVGGMLGLEMRQQVGQRGYQLSKRIVDTILCALGSVFIVPLVALIALWVKLDSGGKVIYGQRRIGLGGRWFTAWKFRSMVENADAVLEEYLRKDPALRREWERDHKLKSDPRVTRAGRFLRKTSLDELPQLWNVLMGDMSLVGPRPIVEKEISKYGRGFDLFTRVKGGITGLWQVSGRNDTTMKSGFN